MRAGAQSGWLTMRPRISPQPEQAWATHIKPLLCPPPMVARPIGTRQPARCPSGRSRNQLSCRSDALEMTRRVHSAGNSNEIERH
jgi:hypothetical protein